MSKPTISTTDGSLAHASDITVPLTYLLDSNNPTPQFRNFAGTITTDSSGHATITYTPFPTAESGAPVVCRGDGYVALFFVTGHTNGSVTIYATTASGAALASVGPLAINVFVAGN